MNIHRLLLAAVSGGLLAGLIAPAGQSLVQSQSHSAASAVSHQAPFIIQDTITDSPGTNIVTRIVTLTAQVGGSPPLTRQWQVDVGHGFVLIPGATNATFRIGNAQPSDSGRYALFATNPAGQTNTTPVSLIVIEGED